MRVSRRGFVSCAVLSVGAGSLAGATVGGHTAAAQESQADLAGLKSYLTDNVGSLVVAASLLASEGQRYYDLAAGADFDFGTSTPPT